MHKIDCITYGFLPVSYVTRDPLWEKVQYGANIDFPVCAYISMVLANIVYDTDENYNLASTFSRRNEVDLPLVAPAASPRSCERCLRVYCIIKFPHVISPNNARGRVRALLRTALERKQLRRCGFLRCMQRALRSRTIRVTQFRIFVPNCIYLFPERVTYY